MAPSAVCVVTSAQRDRVRAALTEKSNKRNLVLSISVDVKLIFLLVIGQNAIC